MGWLTDHYMQQYDEEKALYDKAYAALTPNQKNAWQRVMEKYEYFDGEHGIALGVLERHLAERKLGR